MSQHTAHKIALVRLQTYAPRGWTVLQPSNYRDYCTKCAKLFSLCIIISNFHSHFVNSMNISCNIAGWGEGRGEGEQKKIVS